MAFPAYISTHYISINTYSSDIIDFEPFPNEHASGATSLPNIDTLAECKAACENDDACEALDWE